MDRMILYLTAFEAGELRDSLDGMLSSTERDRHEHVPSMEYGKEITVCIYDPSRVEGFNGRSKKIIETDT